MRRLLMRNPTVFAGLWFLAAALLPIGVCMLVALPSAIPVPGTCYLVLLPPRLGRRLPWLSVWGAFWELR